MMPSPKLVPRRCAGLISKIRAGECVLVLGPRVTVPVVEPNVSRRRLMLMWPASSWRNRPPWPTNWGRTNRRRSVLRPLFHDTSNNTAPRPFAVWCSKWSKSSTRDRRSSPGPRGSPVSARLQATPDRMMVQAFRDVGKSGVLEASYNYCRGGRPTSGCRCRVTIARSSTACSVATTSRSRWF